MGKFTVTNCGFDGLFTVEPTLYPDERGYFMESFNERELAAAGIGCHFVQDNQSMSTKGVFRGLHYQHKHPQAKLVRALSGELYDVVVDLRTASKTFGRAFGILLSEKNQKQLFVPRGFAHGYFCLSDSVVFAYKCDDYYTPEDECGILFCDPELAITLPSPDGLVPVPNERDLHWNTLKEAVQKKLVF